MKYLVATFNIETTADLMQACQDLLADGAAEAGFESFEETETGMEAYVQKDLFDKEALDEYIADFPIVGTPIHRNCLSENSPTGIRYSIC